MRAMRSGRVASALLGLALGLTAGGCGGSRQEPGEEPGPAPFTGVSGPHKVGHLFYTLADGARASWPVAISVWYPADRAAITAATPLAGYPFAPFVLGTGSSSSAEWESLGYDRAYERPAPSPQGPFPLVILSPGHTCPSWYHVGLAARLATHGYVTAVLDHYGEGNSPVSITLQESMFHRPRDVSFVITDLLAKNGAPGDLLHGVIDASRIAAGGHSLAGYAGLALAAGDDLVCDSAWAVEQDGRVVQSTCLPTAADARIRAIVSLDGSAQLLRYSELGRVPVPSLLMGQAVASLTAAGSPFETFLARPHAAIQRPDSYRVDVERAVHNSFGHLCDGLGIAVTHGYITPGHADSLRREVGCQGALAPAEVHQVMTRYVVAFLNVHLRGITSDAGALTEADAPTHTPAVHFFESEACSATLPGDAYFSYRTLQRGGVCAVAEKDPPKFFAPP